MYIKTFFQGLIELQKKNQPKNFLKFFTKLLEEKSRFIAHVTRSEDKKILSNPIIKISLMGDNFRLNFGCQIG